MFRVYTIYQCVLYFIIIFIYIYVYYIIDNTDNFDARKRLFTESHS